LRLDPQSRSLSTEIDLENADLKLLPGAFVTAKVLLEERPDVLTLPISAIVKTPAGTVCCLVVGGKIEHRPIELGLRVGDDVQIVSGLDGSEAVVLMRAGSFQPGQPVEVIAKK
jgi:multidrug efflux pump subunit AcrA (membrane-fusion protein)